MSDALEQDAKQEIVPVYHDESIWNKFMVLNTHLFHFLTPEYCFPESWTAVPNLRNLSPKLLALDKNHAEMRS